MTELQSIWTWQPALYLFLGGMGAGAFVMASILYYRYRRGSELTIEITAWSSVVCLAVGLLLLLTELTNPLRGMMLWQSFSHTTSWMMIGAWLLFAAVIVMGIVAVLGCKPLMKLFVKDKAKLEAFMSFKAGAYKVLIPIGMVLGVGVAVYTGILLMSAPGVPFWNTALLPCLFTVSALDTGVALVEVISLVLEKRNTSSSSEDDADSEVALRNVERSHSVTNRIVVVLVILEVIVLMALLMTSVFGGDSVNATTAALSARTLIWGQLAPSFWAFVVCLGLILPLVVAAIGAKKRTLSSTLVFTGAFGAMLGGCALRFLVLAVGLHADVVGDAITHIFS